MELQVPPGKSQTERNMRTVPQLKKEIGFVPVSEGVLKVDGGLPVTGILHCASVTLVARDGNGEERLFSPLRLTSPEEVRAVLGLHRWRLPD